MMCRVIRSMAIKPAGLRRSWSARMAMTSGSNAFSGKCRPALAYPRLESVDDGVAAGSLKPIRMPASGRATSRVNPNAATRIGPGQRATVVPTRRQRRAVRDGRGSRYPRRTARLISAGVNVSAATMVARMPMAQGNPAVRNDPTWAKTRQANATDTVSADPITTGAMER